MVRGSRHGSTALGCEATYWNYKGCRRCDRIGPIRSAE
jgi:hypothetical protein